MGGGPPGFRQGFTCPVLLGIPLGLYSISLTGLSPSMAGLSRPFCYRQEYHVKVPQPHPASGMVWAVPRSLATTCGITICFLFLRVLRCFTSPGVALKPYFIQTPVLRHYSERVSPFGNPRIKACLPLPGAYRSLPRPSSPADAKASIACSSAFDQKKVNRSLPATLYRAAGRPVHKCYK